MRLFQVLVCRCLDLQFFSDCSKERNRLIEFTHQSESDFLITQFNETMKLNKKLLILFVGISLAGNLAAQNFDLALFPVYGGFITSAQGDDLFGFDPVGHLPDNPLAQPAYDPLLQVDWSRGPAGTGEFPYNSWGAAFEVFSGALAESYERPTPISLLFKIRQGVHFWDKAPANGREMNAHDVVASWDAVSSNPLTRQSEMKSQFTWTALNQWTVELKWKNPVADLTPMVALLVEWMVAPQEVFDQEIDRNDWKYAVGTGPFFISDYVKGIQTVYKRNPNYWQKDPLRPQYQLPYLDGFRYVKLGEALKVAALRTRRVDTAPGVLPVRYNKILVKSNPHLKFTQQPLQHITLTANITKAPFNDKRVRQALMLAINHQEMRDGFYRGNAIYPVFPTLPGLAPFYISLEEMQKEQPETARLFEYHPKEAERLLAEAGYPNGFTTNIIAGEGPLAEAAHAISRYLNLVGIALQVDVVKMKNMYRMTMTRNPDPSYKGLATSDNACPFLYGACQYEFFLDPRSSLTWQGQGNKEFEDSELGQKYIKMWDDLKATMDAGEYLEKWRNLTYWVLDESWFMPLMVTTGHHYWQPWLYGLDGGQGYMDRYIHIYKYAWIDAGMKKRLSGRDPNE